MTLPLYQNKNDEQQLKIIKFSLSNVISSTLIMNVLHYQIKLSTFYTGITVGRICTTFLVYYWDYGATNNDSDIISMTMIVITSQITGDIILNVLIITQVN